MNKIQEIDVINILTRLKSALGLKSDIQLANTLGILPTTLSNWKARQHIDYERVLLLCFNRGINPEWLIKGVGVKYSDGRSDNESALRRVFYVRRNPEILTPKGHHLEICRDKFIDIDFTELGLQCRDLFIFEVYDDTMTPDISSGDRVLFQFVDNVEVKEYIVNNRIVLFEHKETLVHYFRRVAITQSTGEKVLCTNDPDFPVFKLDEGMIVGIVKGVIRLNTW